MIGQTEAACLLESGVLYGSRLLLKPAAGDPIFAGFKPGTFSLYFGDAPIFHFDREGRWQRAYHKGLHYLKALDTSVQTIDRVREGESLVLKRKTLTDAETGRFDSLVRSTAIDLIAALDDGRLERVGPVAKGRPVSAGELRAFLERVSRWDEDAWRSHRERYRAAYGPLPFLPPDCTSPVVLQATLGDGQPALTPGEFERHAAEVAALLGRRVEQCKTVFLGGPDVLRLPVADVASYLETAVRHFAIDPTPGHKHPDPSGETPHRLDGVHAFLDRFTPPLPGPEDWRKFHALGLVRIGLGVESGDSVVRGLSGKEGSNDAIRTLVSDLKGAGIGVGVVVLVGAGGVANAEAHVAATEALVNSLDLGPGDVVSLIDAREMVGPAAFVALDDAAHNAQRDELRKQLEPVRAMRKAKVVPYSLEKQK